MRSRSKRILELAEESLRLKNNEEQPSTSQDNQKKVFDEESILSAPIVIDDVEYPEHFNSELLFDDIPNLSFYVESCEVESSIILTSHDHNYCSNIDSSTFQNVSCENVNSNEILQDTLVSNDMVCLVETSDSLHIEPNDICYPDSPLIVGPSNNACQNKTTENDQLRLVSLNTTFGNQSDESVGDKNVNSNIAGESPNTEDNCTGKRKRIVIDDGNERKKWKRSETKNRRMLGKSYVGFKRENRKVSHDTVRGPRQQKSTCSSNKCKISKNRFCDSFSDEERQIMFKKFWECSWEEKRTYVINMIRKIDKKRDTVGTDETKRNFTLEYHLQYANDVKKQVCKTMFLGTLGLNEWMVKNWVDNSDHGLPHKGKDEVEELENEGNGETENISSIRVSSKKTHLKEWIDSLSKMESHYCRKDSKRLYLEGPFHSKQEIYNLYQEKCKSDKVIPLKRNSIMKALEEKKISIFKPRKDQCDTCIAYKSKQITEKAYHDHVIEKDRAREEKEKDKKNAQEGQCIVFTMDLQSVNMCPKTNASALYYSMKLKVYNLTIFNLGTSQCSTYWWNECEGELEASVFTSIVLKHIKNHCIPLPENCTTIVFYSDGCGYQNRNQYLANALLNFSVEHNITIEHKYLVKGHSQMECDSAHALIERRIKNRDIYLPSDYVKISKECKKDKPYDAVFLDHTYFLDYSDKAYLVYKSIRPGKSVGDPAVKDIRAIKYNPVNKLIEYKLCFDEEYKELPQRPNKANFAKQENYKTLYRSQIPLTLSKFNDLQKLKHVLPPDTHSFYDSLPHSSKYVKTQKDI